MTNNTNNKYHHTANIKYEPKFGTEGSLSSEAKDPLPVLTVSILGVQKQRVTIIYGLICLCESRANDITIKRQHNKPKERKMCFNIV